MANTKISQLPAATTLTTGDLLPVVQAGATKQVTLDLLPISTAAAAALAGKDTAGAAAAAQAAAVQRANHTGTQTADTITDGTTNKAYTATERTKLAGIAAGATANRADAATDAAITAAVNGLINGAPGALDTLKELADAMADDAAFSATVTNALALKAPLASPTFTGTVAGITAAMVGADPAGAAAAITPASIGLGNVSNTSDATKPISGPQAAGLYPSTEPGALITSPDGVSQSGIWMPTTTPLTTPSKVISRFTPGVASGWTGGTGDDTTVTLFSDRTYKTVTNGTGGSIYIGPPVFTAQDWSTSIIRIYLRCLNPAVFATLAVNVTMGAGNVASAGINHNMITGEWSVITLNRSQFGVSAGVINWAGVTQVQVRMQDNKGSSGATTIWVGGIELIPDRAATYPNGVFILECDDGYAGQKTLLAPVVGPRGIPVTINVIADRFTGGTPSSGMTPTDLRTFQDKWGWQISCHAYAGPIHGGPDTAAQLEQDFQRQKHWLHANGLHSGVDHYALCPGTGSPVPDGSTIDALRRSFRSARVNGGNYETALPGDPLRLRSILYSGNTVSQLQTNINAVAGAGGALIFTVHDVIAGATDGTSNGLPAPGQTNLATVLDYAASKGMVFRTRADYLDGR